MGHLLRQARGGGLDRAEASRSPHHLGGGTRELLSPRTVLSGGALRTREQSSCSGLTPASEERIRKGKSEEGSPHPQPPATSRQMQGEMRPTLSSLFHPTEATIQRTSYLYNGGNDTAYLRGLWQVQNHPGTELSLGSRNLAGLQLWLRLRLLFDGPASSAPALTPEPGSSFSCRTCLSWPSPRPRDWVRSRWLDQIVTCQRGPELAVPTEGQRDTGCCTCACTHTDTQYMHVETCMHPYGTQRRLMTHQESGTRACPSSPDTGL